MTKDPLDSLKFKDYQCTSALPGASELRLKILKYRIENGCFYRRKKPALRRAVPPKIWGISSFGARLEPVCSNLELLISKLLKFICFSFCHSLCIVLCVSESFFVSISKRNFFAKEI